MNINDKLLNIKTDGIKITNKKDHFYYEATPYHDLNILTKKIKLKDSDTLVDFGSGKGRVLFYFNYLFNNFSKGIEIEEDLIQLANKNKENFIKSTNKIAFIKSLAENYQVDINDNYFFFFNPFDINIFSKVINNIIKSFNEKRRKITIILCYPIIEYLEYIINETDFKLFDYIENDNTQNGLNKFIIMELS